eukprot:scaffold31287_cov56-Isochrysis_galbana.AAC.1
MMTPSAAWPENKSPAMKEAGLSSNSGSEGSKPEKEFWLGRKLLAPTKTKLLALKEVCWLKHPRGLSPMTDA